MLGQRRQASCKTGLIFASSLRILLELVVLVNVANFHTRVDDVVVAPFVATQGNDLFGDPDSGIVFFEGVLLARPSRGDESIADAHRRVVEQLQRLLSARIGLRQRLRNVFSPFGDSERLHIVSQNRVKVGFVVERLPPQEVGRRCLARLAHVIQELSRYGRETFGAGEIEALVVVGLEHVLEQRLGRRHRALVELFLP